MYFELERKTWSWRDSFTIRDAAQRAVLTAEGKLLSWGHKLAVRDPQGHEVAFLSQKPAESLMPRYDIFRDGRLAAALLGKGIVTPRFVLSIAGVDDIEPIEVRGSFWAQNFTFCRNGQVLAEVSKKRWSWTSRYGIDIAKNEDELLILTALIAIHLTCHDQGYLGGGE